MNREQLKVGMKVRLIERVELYPLGIFDAGIKGTVASVSTDAYEEDVVAEVQMDETFEVLDEWDNCLQVHGTDHLSMVYVGVFEVVE